MEKWDEAERESTRWSDMVARLRASKKARNNDDDEHLPGDEPEEEPGDFDIGRNTGFGWAMHTAEYDEYQAVAMKYLNGEIKVWRDLKFLEDPHGEDLFEILGWKEYVLDAGIGNPARSPDAYARGFCDAVAELYQNLAERIEAPEPEGG